VYLLIYIEGETLAIVGESGSGKSVTSRAILGLSAGNAIYEGGSIMYQGQDLMQVPEEDFHEIRGSKISMIFQDPNELIKSNYDSWKTNSRSFNI